MISYFESLVRNSSNVDFVISRICALITALCTFAFAEYPTTFPPEGLIKNIDLGFLQPHYTFQSSKLVPQKACLACLDCTRSQTNRVAGGGKLVNVGRTSLLSPCEPGHPQTGDLEAIIMYASYPRAPNDHGRLSIVERRVQALL
jgi:hypothetical protein